jgi:hypothetical protein
VIAGDRQLDTTGTRPSTPIRDTQGDLPERSPGQFDVLEDGVQIDVVVSPTANGGLQMEGSSFVFVLEVPGIPAVVTDDGTGSLQLTPRGEVEVSGTGFQPGSLVDVWLFSDPVFVGTALVEADGTFSVRLTVPIELQAGSHTLQANGLSESGNVRSLNLGVEVLADTLVLPATGHGSDIAAIAVMLLMLGLALRRSSAMRSE